MIFGSADAKRLQRWGAPTFRPSNFAGAQYVPGVDVAADMFALQAAFDAAAAYQITYGVPATVALGDKNGAPATYLNVESGQYFSTWVRNIASSFNLIHPTHVEGENSTFKLARMPNLYPGSNTCFNWFHVGTGYDIFVDPPLVIGEITDAGWHFTHGWIIRDLNFDASVLTLDNLIRLTGTPTARNVTGSVIEFAGVGFPNAEGDIGAGALLENIHTDVSFGTIGHGCNARSNCILFDGITVDQVYNVGVWVDGTRRSKIDHVTVLGAHPNADNPMGMGGENNTDCGMGIQTTEFCNFDIRGMKNGVGFGGVDCEMHHGTILMPAAGTSLTGVLVGSSSNEKGVYPTIGGSFHDVSIQRDPATAVASYFAFTIHGTTSAYGDAPVDGVNIHDNVIGASPKKLQYAVSLGNYVDNLIFTNNHYWVTSGDTNSGQISPGLVFTSGHPEYLTGNDFSGNTAH